MIRLLHYQSKPNAIIVGKVAAGTENGILYIGLCEPPGDPNGSGGNSTFKSHHTVSDDGITALSFSPDGTMLAIGSQDSIIYVMQDNLEIIILGLGFPSVQKLSHWRLWTTKRWIWIWWHDDNRGTYFFLV